MSLFRNLKDWFTDLLGAGIMIATGIGIYQAKIVWVWEGIIGMTVGFILLWVPDEVILKHIKYKVKKKIKED